MRTTPALNRHGRPVVLERLEDRRLLSSAPVATLANLDGLPSNTRLVFNRIQNPNPQVNDIVHDTDTLRVTNTGGSPLLINSVALSDATDWTIVNPPAPGTSVAPGASIDLTIKFVAQTVPAHSTNQTNDVMGTDGTPPAQGGGVYTGTLTVSTNDPANPTSTVALAGYWQKSSEHEEEPNLQTIVNLLYGYGTNISSAQQPDYANNGTSVVSYGQEVLSGLWNAADASQPVTVRELAAFHTQVDPFNAGHLLTAQLGWYSQGNSGATHHLFSQAQREAQTLLPDAVGASGAAQGSFRPGGTFGFNVDGELSQDSLNTVDIQTFGRSGHAVRFYPAIDAQGNRIANTWIMAEDYQNSSFDNSDYQDNVYLVTNVQPAAQTTPVTPAPATVTATGTDSAIALQWSAVSDGTLIGYNVYRASAAAGPYTKLNAAPLSATSYTDTSVPADTTEYYRVTAVDANGESQGTGASAARGSGSVGTPPPTGGTPTPGSPLVLSAVTGKFPAAVVAGSFEKAPARVIVTNAGSTTARGVIELDLFASTTQDSIPTGATPLITIMRRVNLKAGKSRTFAFPRFRMPADLSGNEFLVAEIKGVSGITETTGVNSSASSIRVAAPFIDLQNQFASAAPALVAGKATVVTIPVLNNGNVVATGTATVTLTASHNQSTSGGTTLASVPVHVSIQPGKTRSLRVRFLAPTLASGTYFLVSSVSIAGDVDPANNVAASSNTFTV